MAKKGSDIGKLLVIGIVAVVAYFILTGMETGAESEGKFKVRVYVHGHDGTVTPLEGVVGSSFSIYDVSSAQDVDFFSFEVVPGIRYLGVIDTSRPPSVSTDSRNIKLDGVTKDTKYDYLIGSMDIELGSPWDCPCSSYLNSEDCETWGGTENYCIWNGNCIAGTGGFSQGTCADYLAPCTGDVDCNSAYLSQSTCNADSACMWDLIELECQPIICDSVLERFVIQDQWLEKYITDYGVNHNVEFRSIPTIRIYFTGSTPYTEASDSAIATLTVQRRGGQLVAMEVQLRRI